MLTRVHVRNYKSLANVEVKLEPLTVLFGPNAAGKSNLLDVLQLLSKLGTSRTLKDAFDSPYRGKPLESFRIGKKGIKGLVEQERLVFSIEADLRLSDAVVNAVDRQIRDMRRPGSGCGRTGFRQAARPRAGARPALPHRLLTHQPYAPNLLDGIRGAHPFPRFEVEEQPAVHRIAAEFGASVRLGRHTQRARAPVVLAVPDPHVERWLLLDGAAFKAAVGHGCDAPDQK